MRLRNFCGRRCATVAVVLWVWSFWACLFGLGFLGLSVPPADDFRLHQKVEEFMGVVDIVGIRRYGDHIEPGPRAFLGNRIGHFHPGTGFVRPVACLQDIARPSDHGTDVAIGKVVDIL